MKARARRYNKDMKLNDAARELIGDGTDATLVTLNADAALR